MSMLRKLKIVALGLLGAVMFFAAGNNVIAHTPDGETPAVETVCEDAGLTGAAFGLCNAYCEAMDCDHPDSAASPKACQKVQDNFAKHSEVPLPCVEVAEPCPCLDLAPVTLAANYDSIDCFGEASVCPLLLSEITLDCGVENSEEFNIIELIRDGIGCQTDRGPNSPFSSGLLTPGEYATCAEQINEFCTL